MTMNNENIMDFMNNNTSASTFDFGKNWNDEFIKMDEEDENDIIIHNKEKDDTEFENSFEDDDRILSIIRDEPKQEINFEKALTTETTELDSFFDSIYNGVEDANELISQINLKKVIIAKIAIKLLMLFLMLIIRIFLKSIL